MFHVEHRIANFYIDELACAWSADRRLDVRFGDAGEADPLDLTFARGCFTWNAKSLEGDALRSSWNMDTGSAVLVSSGSTWNVRFQTSKVRSARST